MDVLVAGGSGFVGSALCRVLDERGHTVTAASRTPDSAVLPATVKTQSLDVTIPDLTDAVAGHDVVVNLVALASHAEPTAQSHDAVQRAGTAHLVRAAERTGVRRFVLVSGLGVESDIETAYFDAKRDAEAIVRDSDLEWVIYRPSIVFGDGCAFLPFVDRMTPPVVAPLPDGGKMRLQPIWVEDFAPMVADGVEGEYDGQTFDIGGPEVLTLADVARMVSGTRVVAPVPMPLAAVALTLAEYVPLVPLGRDQYRVFAADNVTDENDVEAFGVAESDLLTLGEYLDTKA